MTHGVRHIHHNAWRKETDRNNIVLIGSNIVKGMEEVMKRSVINSIVIQVAATVGLLFSLTSCVTMDAPSNTKVAPSSPAGYDALAIEYPDRCTKRLRQLEKLEKENVAESEFSNWSNCILSCGSENVLNETIGAVEDVFEGLFNKNKKAKRKNIDCVSKCKNKFNTSKIADSFITTSDEEAKRLQQLNQAIAGLQHCRNLEATSIRNELSRKNLTSAQKEDILARYDVYKMRIANDNLLIERLVKDSGNRIEESEEAASQAGLIRSGVSSLRVKVRPGFNIRSEPSTNGSIVGKTKNRNVVIQSINGDWVTIDHKQAAAYVHRTAFPSLTPQQEAELAHAKTKTEHKKAQESQYDYRREMERDLAEIDEMMSDIGAT
jgi:hypothetical protein